MKKTITLKMLSLFIAVIMVIGLLPLTAFAVDDTAVAKEGGTEYCTVTFDPNGGSFITVNGNGSITITVPKGTVLGPTENYKTNRVYDPNGLPPNPVQYGGSLAKIFQGWQIKGTTDVILSNSKTLTVNEDLELVAKWANGEGVINQFVYGRVEYYDGDTLLDNYSYSLGQLCRAIIEPNPEPTKAGYIFGGWRVREGCAELTVEGVKTYAVGDRFTDFGLVVPVGRGIPPISYSDYVYKFEAIWELYSDEITVRKVDQYGKPMANVDFTLESYVSKPTGGKIQKNYTTDANGEFTIKTAEIDFEHFPETESWPLVIPADQAFPNFTLKEKVPEGYTAEKTAFTGNFRLEGTRYTLTIDGAEPEGDTVVLKVQNHKIETASAITVKKVDQYGEPIEGVKFDVWTVLPAVGSSVLMGTLHKYYETDENGKFVIDADEVLSQPADYVFYGDGPMVFPGFLLTEETLDGYLKPETRQYGGRFVETGPDQYDIEIPEARRDENGDLVLTVVNTAADLTIIKEVYGIDAEDVPGETAFTAEPLPPTSDYTGKLPQTLETTYDEFEDGSYLFKGPVAFWDYMVKEDYETASDVEGYTLFVDYQSIPYNFPPFNPPEPPIKKAVEQKNAADAAEKVEEIVKPGTEIIPGEISDLDPVSDEDYYNPGIVITIDELNYGEVTVSNVYLRDLGLVKLVKETEGLPEGKEVPADATFRFLDEDGSPVEFLVMNEDSDLSGAEPVTEVTYAEFIEEEGGQIACTIVIPTGSYTLEETKADVDGYVVEMTSTPDPIVVEKAFDLIPRDYMTRAEMNAFINGELEIDPFREIFRPFTLTVGPITPFDPGDLIPIGIISGNKGAEESVSEIVKPIDGETIIDITPVDEEEQGPQLVTVKNKYVEGSRLIVTKTFEGIPEESIGRYFCVVVSMPGYNNIGLMAAYDSLQGKTDQGLSIRREFSDDHMTITWTVTGIPAGKSITITESSTGSQDHQYTLDTDKSVTTGSVDNTVNGETYRVDLLNVYKPATHTLQITKELGDGSDMTDMSKIPGTAEFDVIGSDGTVAATVTYRDFNNGSAIIEVPLGTYTVRESGADIKGYDLETEYSIKDNTPPPSPKGVLRADASPEFEVTYNKALEVVVTNTYTKNGDDPTPPDPPTPPTPPTPPELDKENHYGYIIGYPDGTVRPGGNITRAEVATIFFRLLTEESRKALWCSTNDFTDVSRDQWFNNAVSTLSNAGIVSGYPDGSFRPGANITRAELATMVARFLDTQISAGVSIAFSDIEGHWAEGFIIEVAENGIINGYPDGTFKPDQAITRAEAVTMVNRLLERKPDKDHLLDDMIVWPDNMDTGAWYYAAIQEATNSHSYEWGPAFEIWMELREMRDWEALEKEWSEWNSSPNPGDVMP